MIETGSVNSSTGSEYLSYHHLRLARYEGGYEITRHPFSFLFLVRLFEFQVCPCTRRPVIDETPTKTGHGPGWIIESHTHTHTHGVTVTGDARGTAPAVPRWGGRASPKLSEPGGGCVDTERSAYIHDLRLSVCRIKPLAVDIIAGVQLPDPMFRLDTSPGRVLCWTDSAGVLGEKGTFLPRVVLCIRGWIGQASRG